MAATDKAFLGTGWGFPPRFQRHADTLGVDMVEAESDIDESLRILLSTRPGERVMQPAYGCGLHSRVFDNITESAVTRIKDLIERAVLFHEPRITLDSIDIDTTEALDGVLNIRLNYTVRQTNSRRNMVYPFYYREADRVPR